MTQTHPITPPPELVQLWMSEDAPWDSDSFGVLTCRPSQLRHVATQAAQWGADTELEACVEFLRKRGVMLSIIEQLRAARRPKPPSLKEQALESLHHLEAGCEPNIDLLRRALEALDD
jgi:hypothetical protein